MAKPNVQDENFKHIIRIANVDLPGEKVIRIALSEIKGIGINFADALCNVANVNKSARTGKLTDEEIKRLNEILGNPLAYNIPVWMLNHQKDFETGENKHILSGTLQFVQDNDIKRLKKIKTYKGVRHIHGQPVRGQRTKSNFRKNKGKVVGVAKKKIESAAKEEGGKKEKK